MSMGEQYYIGGKRYSPEESIELCTYDWIVESATLYQSPKGALFIVEKMEWMEPVVRILTRSEAFSFMDNHPAGIVRENYTRTFGEPEPG